jgi:hypothetical protein
VIQNRTVALLKNFLGDEDWKTTHVKAEDQIKVEMEFLVQGDCMLGNGMPALAACYTVLYGAVQVGFRQGKGKADEWGVGVAGGGS